MQMDCTDVIILIKKRPGRRMKMKWKWNILQNWYYDCYCHHHHQRQRHRHIALVRFAGQNSRLKSPRDRVNQPEPVPVEDWRLDSWRRKIYVKRSLHDSAMSARRLIWCFILCNCFVQMECASATINMFMYGQAMAIVVFNDIPTHTRTRCQYLRMPCSCSIYLLCAHKMNHFDCM